MKNHVSYFMWADNIENAAGISNPTGETFFTEANSEGFDISGEKYHTLSSDEWTYVITNRPVQFHSWAKVYMQPSEAGKSKVPGLLLFPCEATGEGYTLDDNAFINDSEWDEANVVNEMDLDDGKTYAGCTFLPGIGTRDNTTVSNVGRGCYWSSSTVPNDNQAIYRMYFDNTGVVGSAFTFIRSHGYAVRPVRVL